MIFDAKYWKADLRRIAKVLDRRRTRGTWRRTSYGPFERDVMFGFYAIRKLSESHRLNEHFGGRQVPVITYPWNGRRVGYFAWPNIQDHFDLTRPTLKRESVKDLCDWIIHSSVFSPWFTSANRLAGIFFCSDRRKHVEVIRLDIQRAIDLFRAASGSRPAGWLRVAPRQNRQVL